MTVVSQVHIKIPHDACKYETHLRIGDTNVKGQVSILQR